MQSFLPLIFLQVSNNCNTEVFIIAFTLADRHTACADPPASTPFIVQILKFTFKQSHRHMQAEDVCHSPTSGWVQVPMIRSCLLPPPPSSFLHCLCCGWESQDPQEQCCQEAPEATRKKGAQTKITILLLCKHRKHLHKRAWREKRVCLKLSSGKQ